MSTDDFPDVTKMVPAVAGRLDRPVRLADMAIRFGRLSSAAAKDAAAKCLQMKALAERLA